MTKHVLFTATLLAAGAGLVPVAAQEEGPGIAEGAVVYAATCGRCHNPRAGTERTDREWVPIVAHMRARGNLTKREAQAVLMFLQATNLAEGVGTPSSGEATPSLPPGMPLSLRLEIGRVLSDAPRGNLVRYETKPKGSSS